MTGNVVGEVVRVTIRCKGAMLGAQDKSNKIVTMHYQPCAVAHGLALRP